jgi:hypothetical protein
MRKGFSSGRQRRRHLRGLIQLADYIPRQQLLDAIDRIVGDALEYVMKIALRVDVIEFARSCRAPDYAERAFPEPIFRGFASV